MGYKILLVEDDPNLGMVVSDLIEMEGHLVQWSRDGLAALADHGAFRPQLCVIDVMLPKKDGFQVAAAIRRTDPKVPIIFLTARDREEDRVKGFETGADDYITKPFSNREFILRLDAILKRCYGTMVPEQPDHKLGKLVFSPQSHTLTGPEGARHLTPRESETLELFCRHQGRTLSREDILKAVWGNDDYFTGRSLDVFITKLRKHLSPDPDVRLVNVHGVGFRLEVGP
jgi:DNA-binding response OmpR family regulator